MAYRPYQDSDNIVPYYTAIIADELADIETLPTDYAPGSSCLVIEDSSVWVLNTKGQWKQLGGE